MTTPQPDILDRLDAMALFLKEKALHDIIWDAMEEIRELRSQIDALNHDMRECP